MRKLSVCSIALLITVICSFGTKECLSQVTQERSGWDEITQGVWDWVTIDTNKGHDFIKYIEKVDGGFICTGAITESGSLPGDGEYWRLFVRKYDENLDDVWTYVYDGDLQKNHCGNCVRETLDGNYIVVGSTNIGPISTSVDNWWDLHEDIIVIMLQENNLGDAGVELWKKTYMQDSVVDRSGASFVIQDSSTDYVISGLRGDLADPGAGQPAWRHALLFKIRDNYDPSTGTGGGSDPIWEYEYDLNSNSGRNWFSCVRKTSRGNYIAVGGELEQPGRNRMFLANINVVGTLLPIPKEVYAGVVEEPDGALPYYGEARYISEEIQSSNQFIVTGYAKVFASESYSDAFLWRITDKWKSPADTIWFETFGEQENIEYGWSVDVMHKVDADYIYAGGYKLYPQGLNSSKNAWLLSVTDDWVNPPQATESEFSFSSGTESWERIFSVEIDPVLGGTRIVCGGTMNDEWGHDPIKGNIIAENYDTYVVEIP